MPIARKSARGRNESRPYKMEYDRDIHHRRSIRLSGYDYTQSGAYFVTICVDKRVCVFGALADGSLELNDAGRIARNTLSELPSRFSQISLDSFIVMPNHIHGIIFVGAQFIAPSDSLPHSREEAGAMNHAPTLGEIIRAYKAVSARAIRCGGYVDFKWQRNYYEHIIRDEDSLNRIRQYILDNPIRWDSDRENPAAAAFEPKDAWQSR